MFKIYFLLLVFNSFNRLLLVSTALYNFHTTRETDTLIVLDARKKSSSRTAKYFF